MIISEFGLAISDF